MAHKTSMAFRSIASSFKVKNGLLSSSASVKYARFLSSGGFLNRRMLENGFPNYCSVYSE